MTPKQLLAANLELVSELAPDLIARFYATLFFRNPELKSLFGRRSAAAQERMLLEAVLAVVEHMDDAAWLRRTLRPLGAKHLAYGVKDDMYPVVADALIATLRDASGDAWNDQLEETWSGALGAVATEMIIGAREAEIAPTARGIDLAPPSSA
jgi:hemoglobin-like flavoprotein